MPSVQEFVEELSAQACMELFQAYGIELTRVGADVNGAALMYCGIAGFVGPELRGACLLATTEHPLTESDRVRGEPKDWAAELTNQLLGRIKNKLAAHGAKLVATIPVVIQGKHIAPLPRHELVPIAFHAAGGHVFLWMEVEAVPGIVLAPVSASEAPVPEGDTVLF